MSLRHFLDLDLFSGETLRQLLALAAEMKKAGRQLPASVDAEKLRGLTLAMIFEQPSTRTRVSFDVGMRQLGGETIVLTSHELQMGRGESLADTARVLSRYVDGIMVRIGSHDALLELVEEATVPVINGLTGQSHPCQVLADLMTVEEHIGPMADRKIAWVGDANNVARSWIHAAARLGFAMRIAAPKAFQPDAELRTWIEAEGADVEIGDSAEAAVAGVDCVIADTWVSMGDEDEKRRLKLLQPFRVDAELMAHADENAIFLHCLPAYRGNEVTADVIDGPQSAVFDEAENRLHVQKAILAWCFEAVR